MDDAGTLVILAHALIGVAGALSITVFVWGFVIYISRLGTERRVEGIRIMEWGVGLIIAALFLIGILRFLQG